MFPGLCQIREIYPTYPEYQQTQIISVLSRISARPDPPRTLTTFSAGALSLHSVRGKEKDQPVAIAHNGPDFEKAPTLAANPIP